MEFEYWLIFGGVFLSIWIFYVHTRVDTFVSVLQSHTKTFEHFLVVCQGHEARLIQLEQELSALRQQSEPQTQYLVRPGCEL